MSMPNSPLSSCVFCMQHRSNNIYALNHCLCALIKREGIRASSLVCQVLSMLAAHRRLDTLDVQHKSDDDDDQIKNK